MTDPKDGEHWWVLIDGEAPAIPAEMVQLGDVIWAFTCGDEGGFPPSRYVTLRKMNSPSFALLEVVPDGH